MQKGLISSALLKSMPGISHGFLTNHEPGASAAFDQAEPGISTASQVHGNQLLWVNRMEKREREADALATFTPGLKVGVYSADCTPILLAAIDSSGTPLAVMAIHAGWRGTAKKIAEISFEQFHRKAADLGSKSYVAAIGPCISYEKFEVGEEVIAAFPSALENETARFFRNEEGRRKFLFDLPGENRRQLIEFAARHSLDLKLEQMPLCTFSEKSLLPSYRRDGLKAGRILSYLEFQG